MPNINPNLIDACECGECDLCVPEAPCNECGDPCDARYGICSQCEYAGQSNYEQSMEDSYMTAIRGY